MNLYRFLPLDVPLMGSNCLCRSSYTGIVSRLHIIKAELIVTPKELDGISVFGFAASSQMRLICSVTNIFCQVNCENQVFKTKLNSSTTGLFWDESFLLYRKEVHLPVIIKVLKLT